VIGAGFEIIITFHSKIDIFGIILLIAFAVSLFCSWIITFLVIKVFHVFRMPLDDKMIDFFEKEENAQKRHHKLVVKFKKAFEENRKIINRKAYVLNISHILIVITFLFAFSLFTWISIKKYTEFSKKRTEEVKNMLENEELNDKEIEPNNDPDPPNPDPDPPDEPSPSDPELVPEEIEPPDFEMIPLSAPPPKETKGDN